MEYKSQGKRSYAWELYANDLTLEEWKEGSRLLMDKYFESHGLIQQISSYNAFVNHAIPTIIQHSDKTFSYRKDNANSLEVHTLEFLSPSIQRRMIWTDTEGVQHKLTPHECRLRDLTYAVDLWATVRKVVTLHDEVGKEKVKTGKKCLIKIGQIPVMVKSDVCMLKGLTEKQLCALSEDPSDPGGYFIVGGKEKVLIAQDRAATNQPFVFRPMCDSKYQFESEIRSSWNPIIDKICATWIRLPLAQSTKGICQQRVDAGDTVKIKKDMSVRRSEVLKTNLSRAKPGLVATIPKCRKDIPLIILYRALRFENDKDIWKTFRLDESREYFRDLKEALRPTFQDPESLKVTTQEEALLYIGRFVAKQGTDAQELKYIAKDLISKEVYPHVGKSEQDDWMKGYHIGDAVMKILNVMLREKASDDRDHLKNKRFDLAGPLLSSLFKTLFKNLQFTSKQQIDRKLEHNIYYEANDVVKCDIIEKGMVYALASGNWGDKRKSFVIRSGVSQLLNRLNPIATLSHLRRVHSPVSRLVRMTPPRHLHNTFYGLLCPAETPEGEQVGLVKNLAAMAYISNEVDTDNAIIAFLEANKTLIVEKFFGQEINTEYLVKETKVYLNGVLIGCHQNPMELVNAFKKLRREADSGISFENSIMYDMEEKEITIRTDAGRAMRPLLVVQSGRLKFKRHHLESLKDPYESYTWEDLLKDGVVEFVDCSEVENCLIAMFPSKLGQGVGYTHCEIHPAMMLGISAGLIPYSNHNQSPRNTYQSAMAKQSVGFALQNYDKRYDPSCHVLYYPQKPLVTTHGSHLCNYDQIPCGINAIVAIAPFHGYNQEDSIILNSSALERGMFRSLYYKTYHEDEINKEAGREERFEKFAYSEASKAAREYMDEDGLHWTGSELKDEEIIIGKTKLLKVGDIGFVKAEEAKRDTSVMHRSGSSSREIIDSTIIMDNAEGYRMVKVRIRSTRVPQIGDKFASRHGQKGVVGMTYSQENMMFTKDGTTPDIIINPHAIPSRMTIGHLIETLQGKVAAFSGEIKNGTPFEDRISYEELIEILQGQGFHGLGNEILYQGSTGRKISCPIFIGPTYYQRLKHMTEDKIHLRGRGSKSAFCRQPPGGINRDGGLRFGEMERDCTISHGAFKFLQERLMKVSDEYCMTVCIRCGFICDAVPSLTENTATNLRKCRRCRSDYMGCSEIYIPYAAKMFFQELMSMNIRVGLMCCDPPTEPTTEQKKVITEGEDEKLLDISTLLDEVQDVGFYIPDDGEDDFRKESISNIYDNFPQSLK